MEINRPDLLPTASCLLPTAYFFSMPASHGFAPALKELLRFVQPAFLEPVLIRWRGLDGVNAGLHRAGGLLVVAEPGVRPADEIQRLRVVRPVVKKLFQHVTRVGELSGGNVGRANLAPNLLLRVSLIALHDLLEMADGFRQSALSAGDAAQLIMRIQLFRIDVDRALKSLARQIQLASRLMDQSQIVMGRCITRINRRRFQVLLESRARALSADNARVITSQEEEEHQQNKRRADNSGEQEQPNRREQQCGPVTHPNDYD